MVIEGPFAVDVERKLRTYVVIWRAADALIGKEGDEITVERSMAAGVLTAFSFEAYLNHVGSVLLKSWEDVERRLGWKEKLSLIVEMLAMPLDKGAHPYQLLPKLFAFRDDLAHGKTRPITLTDLPLPDGSEDIDASMQEMIEQATDRWEQQCEPTVIRNWMRAVEQMMRDIQKVLVAHPKAPFIDPMIPVPQEPEDPFSKKSHGRATLKVARQVAKPDK